MSQDHASLLSEIDATLNRLAAGRMALEACRGAGSPGEPTPLDCLETVLRAVGNADTRLKRSELEAVERLARELRVAVAKAEGNERG